MRIQAFPFCEAPSDIAGSGGGTPSGSSSTITGADVAAVAEPAAPSTPSIDPKEYETLKTRAEKLAWAEGYDNPDEVKSAVELRKWFATDPEAAYDFVTGHMKRAGLIKEPAAPAAAKSPEPLTDAQTGEPLPDIQIKETGELFYSAAQMRKHAQWQGAEWDKKLKPITEAEDKRTLADRERAAEREATAILNEAWKRPGFQEHAVAINAAIQRGESLDSAYVKIALPKLEQSIQARVMADLKLKAKASTHNPGSAAVSSTVDESKLSTKELLKREMDKRRKSA